MMLRIQAYGLFVLMLLLCRLPGLQAQTITMSDEQKISSKTPNLRILGQNDQGIIIYKFGKGVDIIEAYDNKLNLAWTQNLSIKQENSAITNIILYPTFSVAYFIAHERDFSVLYAQILNSRFKSGGKFIVADTIMGNRYDIESKMRQIHSQNKKQLLTYYPVYSATGLEYIQLAGLTDELDLLYRRKITFPDNDNYKLKDVEVTNKGQVLFLFEDPNRANRRSEEKEFKLFAMNAETGQLTELEVLPGRQIYANTKLTVDNVNGAITLSGFTTDEDRKEAKGYFFKSYNDSTLQLIQETIQPFSSAMLYEIVGKDTTRKISGLYSFQVNDLILRQDGGAIIIAESQYNNTQSDDVVNFVPAAGPNFRTVNVFYYNDILVFSLKPGGDLDWFKVLRKKQVSEDDDGFFSSYSLITLKRQLRFIYNEEIYYKTNVNEFIVNAGGDLNRGYLFNAGMRDIMMAPALGKQISGNEILIPSFRNRMIKFIKISY